MISTERLSATDYTPRKDLIYFDNKGMHELYDCVAFNGNHILVGPKGIGKSLSVQAYAHKISCPIITYDCSEDIRRSNLIGSYIIKGGETPFVLGPLPSAFEVANEAGQCILVLEEINSLLPTMQKILNPATDFRQRLEVPEIRRVFKLEPGKKLWIVGTMNPAIYSGVYSLNEDLKSRFRLIPLAYPKRMEETQILSTLLKGLTLPSGLIEKLVLLAHETRQNALEYALSTRDLVQIAEDTKAIGLSRALAMSCGKFEGEDIDAYKHRVESIFEDVRLLSGKKKDESDD